MATCVKAELICAFCGKPIMPLLERWRPCEAGAIHEDCWQEYLRGLCGAVDALNTRKVEVA